METVSLVLLAVGFLIMGIAGIVLLIKAFQQSILWGLGYIFVPFVSLIFVALFWQDTKKPFLYLLGGFALFMAAMVLGGSPDMTGVTN